MILIDTGPLFALFNPLDPDHYGCKAILKTITAKIYTTVPVITEVGYLMRASDLPITPLLYFIKKRALQIWSMDIAFVEKALTLMEDNTKSIDFADASLILAAQALKISRIFTLDKRDFSVVRIQKGHRYQTMEILTP